MQRTIDCFYPGRSFPAISVTGSSCSLNCKHCSGKYLEGMIPATTPDDLLEVAEALAERGARGFLLSGGSDANGRVRVSDFAAAIRTIKKTTDLKINAHIGLSSTGEIHELVECGVDSFSVDIYGDDETISEVLGISAKASDYIRVLRDLTKTGARVAPHVCIGIRSGELRGEFYAIEHLKSLNPETLVLISFMPTKGTVYATALAPSSNAIMSVVEKARKELPQTRLLLGCMRSKLDRSSEYDVVKAGLDGIVLPSEATVERLKADGYTVRKRAECCALL